MGTDEKRAARTPEEVEELRRWHVLDDVFATAGETITIRESDAAPGNGLWFEVSLTREELEELAGGRLYLCRYLPGSQAARLGEYLEQRRREELREELEEVTP